MLQQTKRLQGILIHIGESLQQDLFDIQAKNFRNFAYIQQIPLYTMKTIPSITPYSSIEFDAYFHKETDSLGICFGMNCSLEFMASMNRDECVRNLTSRKVPINKEEWWTEKQEVYVRTTHAQQLVDFYQFATQHSQPYFILRKGLSGLYLAKKTSSYSFLKGSNETFQKRLYPHRISFQIVRELEEHERRTDIRGMPPVFTTTLCKVPIS